MKILPAFLLVSVMFLLASCGPTTEELQTRAIASQQRFEDYRKSYVFTTEEINRCKSQQGFSSEKIETHIRNTLKDPEAAKIRNLKRVCFVAAEAKQGSNESTGSFCGWVWAAEVNGKNGFGAYVGYKTEYLISAVGVKSPKTGFGLVNFIVPTTQSMIDDDFGPWTHRICN